MTKLNKEFEYIECNICNSTDFFYITAIVENNYSLYLVVCKNCGLGFLNPRWTKTKYKEYYETEYDSQYRPQLKFNSLEVEPPKINIVLERFKKAQLLFNGPLRILDIGCGEGANLMAFSKAVKGCQFFAIESSLIATEILRKNGIRIISNDVDSDWDEEFDGFFDVIILRHVLEHFLDPSFVLRKVYKTLKDKGVAYIAVPDNLLLTRKEGWLRIAHTYYFNRFSLNNILKKERLNVISLQEGDKYNSFEVFAFVDKSGRYEEVELSTDHSMLQKMVFDAVLKKRNNTIHSLHSKPLLDNLHMKNKGFSNNLTSQKDKNIFRKVGKKVTKLFYGNSLITKGKDGNEQRSIQGDVINGSPLPEIYERKPDKNKSITHVSAFSYGNVGDTILPVALRDLWYKYQPDISWTTQHVYYPVVDDVVKKINNTKGIVIGGGGLFLKDTNANNISGWQWPCSVAMLQKIKVPIVLFAIGYNRFREQDDFEAVFYENITAFTEKSVYLGLRNHGSIDAIKNYLPENLHHKLVFQPCMTTFLKRLYPDVTNYNDKEDFFVLNCAFDRAHLRFGQNIGRILSDIAIVCKEISKYLPLKFYSHMQSDQAVIPFLQAYNVKYQLVDLQQMHPLNIIKEYTKPKLVIGMRGHAQMIPFGCDTPIVSIISHNKLKWFLDDIGQPEWGVDVVSENFRDELLQRSFSVLENGQLIMKQIDEIQERFYRISLQNTKIALNAIFGK